MKTYILFLLILAASNHLLAESFTLIDTQRVRDIPIIAEHPSAKYKCSSSKKCPVVMFSSGYKVAPEHYRFIAKALSSAGYLVLSIGHELPQDPPLSTSGNLQVTRIENWQRGAQTLEFVREHSAKRFPAYNFEHIVLVGHSNGGDIAAWHAQNDPGYIKTLVTLDNRRAILPRNKRIKLLSIRGADFIADSGVIPTIAEQRKYKSCIVKIANSRHNDMSDLGPLWLQQHIAQLIVDFLSGKCPKGFF